MTANQDILTSMRHTCRLDDPWPTGHPLPIEVPVLLQGPEVGTFVLYTNRYRPAGVVARVLERSYVWSPGECRSNGGFRHYDWSVIEEGPGGYRRVVVNDTDLLPLPTFRRVVTIYSTREH